jgi:hypothetical protein
LACGNDIKGIAVSATAKQEPHGLKPILQSDPEFAALRVFLEEGQVDAGELQAEIDRLVEEVRKASG